MDVDTKTTIEINNTVQEREINIIITKRRLLSGVSPAMRWSLLVCLMMGLTFGLVQFVSTIRFYSFLSALVSGIVIIAAAILVAAVITLLFAAVKRLRWQTSFIVFSSALLCAAVLAALVYILPLLIFCMASVYFAVMCVTGSYRLLSKPKRILRYSLLGLFGSLSLAMLLLLFLPGSSLKTGDRPDKAMLALPYTGVLPNNSTDPLIDPSLSGDYHFSIYYYASSEQKIAPYPGQKVISSRKVDASELLEGWNGIRELMLGFKDNDMPLNAKVWFPEGNGPFPLTLIVHGNHNSGDRSDGGYDYLGELLASRGIIAASVDENYLNSSFLYDILGFAGLKKENDTRAFILLEHLRQWYDWNADASHQFFEKVDFDNIGLIGHSRGGEAVALAAAFAELKYFPDNGLAELNYPFRIKSVVAIAPVHRQYDPAGLEVSLKDVNYLVLHGAHDMDVLSFMGANMYRRTDVSNNGMKAQVWMQHANHGQFNSSWGANDLPELLRPVVNGNRMMPMDEQQQAAKVFVGAFLESTFHGHEAYNALFKDFAQGSEWLPPALYITDYADSNVVFIDDFNDSYDLAGSVTDLAAYSAQGFDKWTQKELPGKGNNSNRVLTLSWGSKEYTEKYGAQTPVFITEFAPDVVSAGDKLYISLCSGKKDADEPDVSFQIILADSFGHNSVMGIDDFGGVINPIDAPIGKPPFSLIFGEREPVLQMVCIPTDRFDGLQGDIVRMEWVFDVNEASKKGQTLYVDDLRVEQCK